MSYGDVFNILTAIEAGAADELSRLMLLNNIRHGKMFNYQIVVKGNKFYAWYLSRMSDVDAQNFIVDKIKQGKK